MDWGAVHQHGIGQRLDYSDGVDAPGYTDGQALATELIDKGHQPDASPVVGLGLYEVEAPDMVGIFGTKPDA